MQSSHIVNQEVNFDNSKESQANTNKHDQNHNLTTSILFQNDQNLFVWRNASLWPPCCRRQQRQLCTVKQIMTKADCICVLSSADSYSTVWFYSLRKEYKSIGPLYSRHQFVIIHVCVYTTQPLYMYVNCWFLDYQVNSHYKSMNRFRYLSAIPVLYEREQASETQRDR